MDLKEVLFYYLLFCSCFVTIESLLCYQCADSKLDGECQVELDRMMEDFVYIDGNTSTADEKHHTKYVKDCSGIKNITSCIIEKIEARGTVEAFIRGCSDGRTFSIEMGRLQNLLPNNETTCAYKGTGQLACVTLCDENLCNGPQVEENNGKESRIHALLLFVCIAIANTVG